jgi:uncharacterized protein YbaR (Trm112 family)
MTNNAIVMFGVNMEKSLLKILVCPQSGAPLELSKNEDELICQASKLAYPIKDGVPVLLVSEARELKDQELGNE